MSPSGLLSGTLPAAEQTLPIRFWALLCDLRARFLAKGRVGTRYRFISRNGRILLATDAALEELAGQIVEARLQIWHRAILPGDKPEPYGFLLCLRSKLVCLPPPLYRADLVAAPNGSCALAIDLGGRLWLEFNRMQEATAASGFA